MKNLPLVFCILAAAAVTGCKKKSISTMSASVAEGATFKVPVPKGYSVATDPRMTQSAPGGVVLVADKRVTKGAFLGSIVVTRVPPGPDFDPSSEKVCKELAAPMTQAMPVKLKGTRLADTAIGKTCQYEVEDNKTPTRGALGTVMCKKRDNCWVVTCNFDTRDPLIKKACAEVLAGWAFK